MTTLNKSEILQISHEIARMVGYDEFPTILSKLWKNRNIEYKEYPSRKHKLPILEGVINSVDLYITLLNVGSKIGFKDDSYYILGTDFCLEKFEKGKVFLTSKSIAYIEKLWNEFCPTMSFSYDFLDDRMKEAYESEERITWIFSLFSLISILIASLGLFGLSSFSTLLNPF